MCLNFSVLFLSVRTLISLAIGLYLENSGVTLLQGFFYEVLCFSCVDRRQREKKLDRIRDKKKKAECLLFWDTAVGEG